jgi:hypothetical protein
MCCIQLNAYWKPQSHVVAIRLSQVPVHCMVLLNGDGVAVVTALCPNADCVVCIIIGFFIGEVLGCMCSHMRLCEAVACLYICNLMHRVHLQAWDKTAVPRS